MRTQHILFVETQGQVLGELMSSLRQARANWNIVLVTDAQAALEVLSQRPISLVVASFGLDWTGCQRFFREVKGRIPTVIRMGLLPDQHKNELAVSLDYAHQCFASHCDSAQLEGAIARGLSVWRRAKENPNLAALISELHTLPTPPALYFQIRDELESPNSGLASVGGIIARDPALSAKVLKVANSGFYALPRSVADLREAITLLGTDTVLALVLAAHLFNQLPIPGLRLDNLWMHCVTVSALARHIISQEGGDRRAVSAGGVAGLLHDIGGLILLANVTGSYFSMIRESGGDESALLQMEREHFGIGHPEVGAHVLGLWGLPDVVVEAVARHHDCGQQAEQEVPLLSKAVCAAEWLLQEYARSDEMSEGGATSEKLLGTGQSQIEDWRRVCERLAGQGLSL